MKAITAIIAGGLVAGAADITYACIHYNLVCGTQPERIFQSVAAGLVGKEASNAGGWGTAALGLAGQGQALGWGLGPGWGQVAGAAAQVGAARLLPQVTTALLPRTLTPPHLPQYWMGSRPGRATRRRLRWVWFRQVGCVCELLE